MQLAGNIKNAIKSNPKWMDTPQSIEDILKEIAVLKNNNQYILNLDTFRKQVDDFEKLILDIKSKGVKSIDYNLTKTLIVANYEDMHNVDLGKQGGSVLGGMFGKPEEQQELAQTNAQAWIYIREQNEIASTILTKLSQKNKKRAITKLDISKIKNVVNRRSKLSPKKKTAIAKAIEESPSAMRAESSISPYLLYGGLAALVGTGIYFYYKLRK